MKLRLAFLLFSHLSQGLRFTLVVIGAFAFDTVSEIRSDSTCNGQRRRGSVNALQFSQLVESSH